MHAWLTAGGAMAGDFDAALFLRMRAEGAQGAARSSRLWVGHGTAGAADIGVGGGVAMAGKARALPESRIQPRLGTGMAWG